MYIYEYINRLAQFDSVWCELILTDTNNILPMQRIPCTFPLDVSEEELQEAAETKIAQAMGDWSGE